jgi:HEAT repeat protein
VKSKASLVVVISVVLVLAGGLLIWGLRNSKEQSKSTPNPALDSYSIELQNNRTDLKAYLNGQTLDEASIYRAVIQLAEVKDPLALEAALRMKQSSSRYFREGSAQALGYFDTADASKALKELTSDREASVRAFAIQALGRSSSEERKETLSAVEEKGELGDEERIALSDARFKAAASDEDREAALATLAKMANGKNASLSSRAALKMVELAPESPQTRDVLHRKIAENTDAPVMGTGIRTLSSQRDPWIASKLTALALHENPLVRKAVIQSLHRVCPPNRWEILSTIARHETDPSVLEVVIDEALLIPEKNIESFFQALAALPLVKQYASKQVEAALESVRNQRHPNACQGR